MFWWCGNIWKNLRYVLYCGFYQCFKKKFVKSSAVYLHFLFTFCFSGTTVMCETPFCNPRVLLTQPDQSVTRDCIAICKQSSACSSFTVGKKIFWEVRYLKENYLYTVLFWTTKVRGEKPPKTRFNITTTFSLKKVS